jgi:hypothetical protein
MLQTLLILQDVTLHENAKAQNLLRYLIDEDEI